MKVERPISGFYCLDVCDACQSALDPSPYTARKCHSCGRELCKRCADWKYYADGVTGDEVRWVAYCAACDATLASGSSEKSPEHDLHRLYRSMQALVAERDAALEQFEERIDDLRAKIHETAGDLKKSLGKYGL